MYDVLHVIILMRDNFEIFQENFERGKASAAELRLDYRN